MDLVKLALLAGRVPPPPLMSETPGSSTERGDGTPVGSNATNDPEPQELIEPEYDSSPSPSSQPLFHSDPPEILLAYNQLPIMHLPSIILVSTIVACGLLVADGSANEEHDKKHKCTFFCPPYDGETPPQGVCSIVTERDNNGEPSKVVVEIANPTKSFDNYYNCVGTDTEKNLCCHANAFSLPPPGQNMTVPASDISKKCPQPAQAGFALPSECIFQSSRQDKFAKCGIRSVQILPRPTVIL
ncbi:hypothetical protein H4Q26_003786 [Puccinia striiformis f. sp. tritici PST-130]|nr:hypothetical protein H4Q26_003786 [Puccinia striiformis f. sp. tritici PST-130]